MPENTAIHAPGADQLSKVFGKEADLWYCPVCGYVDPKTRNNFCPRPHADGIRPPLFVQAVYGYFLRVGLEEASPVQDVRGD